MKTSARLTYESLRFDQPAAAHLVITLTAPPLDPAARRPPVCVLPVIDVSGSMQGEKLQQAKLSVLKLIDHLGPQDRCGVVVFSTEVRVVAPPVEMAPAAKADLKLRVGDLDADAQTNLSGGMLAGLELGNLALLPAGMLVRVILFTDGLANQGVATTSERLLPLLDAHRGRATLSAFGYGDDADQELLSDLARRGAGNYAFVATPDDAVSAFARELGGLLSTYATGLEVRVVPAPGTVVTSVLSDVDASEAAGAVVLRMDDILAEEERHLVLRVGLPACREPATVPAFQVEGRYALVVGGALAQQTFACAVQVDRVEPPLAQARPDQALDLIVAQAELLRAQLDAEVRARRGDYQGAVSCLFQASLSFEDRGHASVASAARAMGERMRDEASFDLSAAHRKSMQAGLARASSSELEGEAKARLRQMGKKFSTRAQDEMDDSFGGSRRGPQAPPQGDGAAPRPPGAGPTPPPGSTGPAGVSRRRSKRW
ncbi:MAG: VWA domain-containing protein [Anaeromyxobacter sp.]|nr:VWA domain-containing protein [Anaeromyxobacter sp.]MBL0275017.1 VWA domain-containing protein [Anaeromyxobacter sp.]